MRPCAESALLFMRGDLDKWTRIDARHGIWALGALVAFVMAGYVLYPTMSVVRQSMLAADGSWTLAHLAEVCSVEAPASMVAARNSILISLLSVLGAAIVGLPLAVFMTTFEFPGRRLCSALLMMPIVLPPLIGVLSFVFLLGESGFLPRGLSALFGLDASRWSLQGVSGVVVVHSYSFYVFFYTLLSSALEGRDPSLDDAARSLGAGRWMRFRKVTIPALVPAAVGASLLVFMTSMASFSAPLLFGGEVRVLSVQIYWTKQSGDLPLASAQTIMLSAISLSFLILLRAWNRRRPPTGSAKGPVRPRRSLPPPASRR